MMILYHVSCNDDVEIDNKKNNLKLILINLDKRKDRLDSVLSSYNKSDLKEVSDLHRLSAVNGRENVNDILPFLSDEAEDEYMFYKNTGKRVGHHALTEGGMGCYMSHVNAWKQVKKFNTPCIIAEDDINIPKDAYANINKIFSRINPINKDKPYIVLFHSICRSHSWDGLECVPVENGVYNAKQFWSLAFYYVTPEAAEIMLDNVFPIKHQVDHMLSELNQRGLIDIFYVNDVVNMAIYDTDIQAPVS